MEGLELTPSLHFLPHFSPLVSTLQARSAPWFPQLPPHCPPCLWQIHSPISKCKRHHVRLRLEAIDYTIALKVQTSPYSLLTRPCVVCIFLSHPIPFRSPPTHTAFTHAHMSASHSAAPARTHFSTCTISAILLPLPGAPASPTFQCVLIPSTVPSASPP